VDLGYAQYFALFANSKEGGEYDGIWFESEASSIQANGAFGSNLAAIGTGGTLISIGNSFVHDLTTVQVRNDIVFAMKNCSERSNPVVIQNNLNGVTLYPGVYKADGYDGLKLDDGQILTLDGLNRANAVWIIVSDYCGSFNGKVEIVNLPGYTAGGSSPVPVWWSLGSTRDVYFNSGTVMVGHVLTGLSVHVATSISFKMGSLLALNRILVKTKLSSTVTVQAYNFPNNFEGVARGYTGTF
jgi:hypothetical protein